jgi:hypothetical protein
MIRNKGGNSGLAFLVGAIAVILVVQLGLGVNLWSAAQMKIDNGIQIMSEKGYQISENVQFEQIKAAGFTVTKESWSGFLQICDQLDLNFGHLTVYADIGAQVMFVYDTSSQSQQAYYVSF